MTAGNSSLVIPAGDEMGASQHSLDHPHPCNFRLTRTLDRGWGEMACEYRWDSTSGQQPEADDSLPDLAHCYLYEVTSYANNPGTYRDGFFFPPDPPFVGWMFRDPTDGRTAPVALGCFPATQGWAWDRHKLGGSLRIPDNSASVISHEPQWFIITAIQEYRFHCQLCGVDSVICGPAGGPHAVVRSFGQHVGADAQQTGNDAPPSCPLPRWRYSLQKHGSTATLDMNAEGYVDDSAHIGFGPK